MPERLAAHHIAVVVRDLDRALDFYQGALGLTVLRRLADAEGRPRAVWLTLGGGAFLALELAASPEGAADRAKPDAAAGWHCVALSIERGEREAWRARLAAAGFPVERETSFTLYTRDPEGALVGLSHYPDAAQ
jgi:catechol 2,3-dioxygenase-like lactoylglutathione lyase family enzyme